MESKGHKNPRACVHRHAYAYASFIHTYAHTCMHTHARVLETIKFKFSTLKLRFGMNHTSFKSHSKLLFSHYKKPYMVDFQHIENPKGKPKIH